MDSYKADHLEMHPQDIARLAMITDAQHVKENELAQMYRTNKYHLRLSPVSFELLIAFLEDNKFIVLLRIVNQHLEIQGKQLAEKIHQMRLILKFRKTAKLISGWTFSFDRGTLYRNIVGAANANEDEVIGIVGHGTHQLSTFNQQTVALGQMSTDPTFREQVEQTLKEEESQVTGDAVSIRKNALRGAPLLLLALNFIP